MQNQLGNNTANAMDYLARFAPKAAEKATKEDSLAKQHRVSVGTVFMQPTGGKNGAALNFSYCYFGVTDSNGNFIGGFNMDNKAMLLLVSQGALGKEFLSTFDSYANKYASKHTIIKSKE